MKPLDRFRVPAERIRDGDGGRDKYGIPIPGAPERTPLPDVLFAPTPTSLPTEAGTAATTTDPTAYWPRQWPDVRPGDRLLIKGTEWHVDGRAADWPMGLAVRLTATETIREVT